MLYNSDRRHDQFFAFLNYFRYRPSSRATKRHRKAELMKPYPIIARQVTGLMVLENMNISDLGIFIFCTVVGAVAKKKVVFNWQRDSLAVSNIKGTLYILIWMTIGVYKAVKASRLRIKGILPNGLPPNISEDPVKYDFTSEMFGKTFWYSVFVMRNQTSF